MAGSAKQRDTWATGFTLVELATVLAIVTVAAAIAVPRYSSALVRYRADSAVRRLAADLELARSWAVTQSESHEVYFDFYGSTYFLYGIEDMDTKYVDTWVQLKNEPYRTTLVSAFGKDINDSGTSLFFDGYGAASPGGEIVLQTGGVTRTIHVNAETGRVTTP